MLWRGGDAVSITLDPVFTAKTMFCADLAKGHKRSTVALKIPTEVHLTKIQSALGTYNDVFSFDDINLANKKEK